MKKIGLLIVLMALSGCSSRNVVGQWDCPAQKGHPCITITEADKIAKNKLEVEQKNEDKPTTKTQVFAEAITESLKLQKKVWFAPYTDKRGNYHEASIVHFSE